MLRKFFGVVVAVFALLLITAASYNREYPLIASDSAGFDAAEFMVVDLRSVLAVAKGDNTYSDEEWINEVSKMSVRVKFADDYSSGTVRLNLVNSTTTPTSAMLDGSTILKSGIPLRSQDELILNNASYRGQYLIITADTVGDDGLKIYAGATVN